MSGHQGEYRPWPPGGASGCPNPAVFQVRVAALQNLVKIMSLYYQYMETYMGPALFAVSPASSRLPEGVASVQQLTAVAPQITVEAMKSDIDEVALQGIEFWSNVCDEEMDLAIEASEVRWSSGRPQVPVPGFEPPLSSNGRPRSRGALLSTPASSTPRGRCSTWCPS